MLYAPLYTIRYIVIVITLDRIDFVILYYKNERRYVLMCYNDE